MSEISTFKVIKERVLDFSLCFNCGTTGIQESADSKKEHYCSSCKIHMDYYKYIDLRVILWEIVLCIDRSARFYLSEPSFNFKKHFRYSMCILILVNFAVNTKHAILNSNMTSDFSSTSLNYQNPCYPTEGENSHISCYNIFKLVYTNPELFSLLGIILANSCIKLFLTNLVTYILVNVIGTFDRKIPFERIWTSITFCQMGKMGYIVLFIYDTIFNDEGLYYFKLAISIHQVFI